jgi:uncharacterized protein YxjI
VLKHYKTNIDNNCKNIDQNMPYCNNCGTENKNIKFCTNCGSELQGGSVDYQQHSDAPTYDSSYQPQMIQANQFLPAEYQVQQKLLSMTQTYKIKDYMGNEFMVARRKMSSIFQPKIEVSDVMGNQIGYIQANFFKTEWSIYDMNNVFHAKIIFPFFMFFTKSFTITTPIGIFRSGESVFSKRFDAYAPDGRFAFVVDKKLFAFRDSFKIQSNGQLGPFVTCLAAVVIDQKFHQNK